MTTRLNDEQLEKLELASRGYEIRSELVEIRVGWLQDALAELHQSRAAALTGEEREALRFARKCVESSWVQLQQSIGGHGMSDAALHQDALFILDKLATTKGEP